MQSNVYLQKAAFDAIDTLHFSQVLTSLMCRSSETIWYDRILTRIYKILDNAGIRGKQAEITKHYLLCAIEIYWSVDEKYISDFLEHNEENDNKGTPYNQENYIQSINGKRNFSLAILYLIASKNGVATEFFSQAIMELINDEGLALPTIPAIIRSRLVECCYALEYPHASLGFYHELVNRNIISCGKYSRKNDKYKQEAGSELSLLFIRAGLLFEFKMLQSTMNAKIFGNNNEHCHPESYSELPPTHKKLIFDYYARLIKDQLANERLFSTAIFLCKDYTSKTRAQIFLKQMSKYYNHKRMLGGTQGSWLGTLGAFYIEVSRNEDPKRAIYYESDNSRTISEEIKETFLERGFSVSARSLYLRHKAIKKDDYAKIRYYYHSVLTLPYIPPWYLNQNDLYDLAIVYKEDDVNG